ncbi:MAG: ribonuclease T2 family protein [Rhizobiaceae bacterium]
MFRVIFLLLAALGVAGCNDNSAQTSPPAQIAKSDSASTSKSIPVRDGFDFYVLSLSWSPHYCASKGRGADPQQCNAGKPFGFIVHGLWPQNERGYPQYCQNNAEPTRNEIRSIADLTPSSGLVRHEWEKHGTCSGLTPSDYFKATRAARNAVIVPSQFINAQRAISLSASQIETAFTRSNFGLETNGIAVKCDRQRLAEVRICLTKSLAFRACPEVDRDGCKAQSVTIEPIK